MNENGLTGGKKMYKSPISFIEGVTKSLAEQMEDNLMMRVQVEAGWDIDRDELLKALKYDRDQYSKGYRDGRLADKWIMCTNRLPEETGWIICTDGKNISVERYKIDAIDHFYPSGRWFEVEDMIAWIPLPSLPKEERR